MSGEVEVKKSTDGSHDDYQVIQEPSELPSFPTRAGRYMQWEHSGPSLGKERASQCPTDGQGDSCAQKITDGGIAYPGEGDGKLAKQKQSQEQRYQKPKVAHGIGQKRGEKLGLKDLVIGDEGSIT